MNLVNLKETVAAYHQKKITDLQIGQVDLFLNAANEVRRKAEQLHNFENCRVQVTIDIDGVTGADLSSVTYIDPDPTLFAPTVSGGPPFPFRKFKEVVAIQGLRGTDQVYVPIEFTRLDIAIERRREQTNLMSPFWPEWRYPSDFTHSSKVGTSVVVQRANKLFIHPPRVTIPTDVPFHAYIDGYSWLNDYTDTQLQVDPDDNEPEDFLIDIGWNYMKWAIILELNPLFSTFVPRQEGNVGTSEVKERIADAWRDLIAWDAYQIDSHITLGG